LQQLLGNLVVNALKYGQAGTPVRVILTAAEGEIVFRVENQGKPIPSATLPELFDPLRRGSDRPHEEGSLGLGLYICREITRAHQGTIAVESDASSTRFTVRIPRICQSYSG
jgi:signal transduction histidine kinase